MVEKGFVEACTTIVRKRLSLGMHHNRWKETVLRYAPQHVERYILEVCTRTGRKGFFQACTTDRRNGLSGGHKAFLRHAPKLVERDLLEACSTTGTRRIS
jgi:hypothetical protein